MNNLKVMVVEDNALDMEVVTSALSNSNIEYFAVSDSDSAMQKAIVEQPRIAVLDMNMPHIDGRMLCESLQTHPATSHIKIIFLTASDSVEDVLFGVNVHAAAYYRKGVPMKELLDKIVTIDFAANLREKVDEFKQFNKNLLTRYVAKVEEHSNRESSYH